MEAHNCTVLLAMIGNPSQMKGIEHHCRTFPGRWIQSMVVMVVFERYLEAFGGTLGATGVDIRMHFVVPFVVECN